jgi:ABC-type transport system involved in multi-copper enzyme maturation permease subunit
MTADPAGLFDAVSSPSGRRRFLAIMRTDLAYHTRRPMFWIWTLTLVLLAWGMSTGQMRIQSGDTSVGGTKAWITSEFAVAKQLAPLTLVFYAFFLAIMSGMSIIQDDEWRLGDLLHSTPLKPAEYVWGKFVAVLCSSVCVLTIHLIAMAFFFHFLPSSAAKEIRGPFQLLNYLRPAIVFCLPTIVLLSGTALAIGEWGRRAILVFVIPLGLLMLDAFFLWSWSPGWLDPRLNRALMLLDPGGMRWLSETWLKVDRGVNFYNTAAIFYDAGFLISRLVLVLLGLGAVALCQRHLTHTLRGSSTRVRWQAAGLLPPVSIVPGALEAPRRPLASLGMIGRRPGILTGAWHVARNELVEIIFSPGLYLFVPLIFLQTIGASLLQVGYLDTPLLVTSGSFAASAMSQLATCVCLLLLWYAVESMERERTTRLAEISHASPVRTGSLLLGKALALAAVGGAIVLATGVGGLVCVLVQGRVPFEFRPFGLLWGLLLFPTFLVWTTFVIAVQTITRNRYTTYAVALCVIAFTGFRLLSGEINWLGNWPLWDAVRWSDMSILELDRLALVLSRSFVLGMAVFFLALTLRFFQRREADPTRTVHQLRPRALLVTWLRLSPCALVPLVAGSWLGLELGWGRESEAAKKQAKDYWRKNVATYREARVPDLKHVEIDLELFPERGRYRIQGNYDLVNPAEEPLREILVTAGQHWENLSWSFDDKPHTPVDRSRLFLFAPPAPLKQGQTARIGFSHQGAIPRGISKRGGDLMEFILPSGVVLTSFGLSIVPALGYVESLGIDDDNRFESREYPDEFYRGQTDSFVGSRSPFSTRVKITGPADFTMNSVGIKTQDTVAGDRRTVLWESDHPVSFYNIVAGRWNVKRGAGTELYYHPGHPYNVDEILACLDHARTYYSEWFFPYPWKQLKLSEFPGLATYAQGFPTNISFSEGVGFLTSNTPEIHFAYEVTAHEAAHQWWGNILTPGKGPGGNVLAEGTAHFSTILLLEQTKGLGARIGFCKRLEDSYSKNRHPDSERPLVKIDGSRGGDNTVTYDKGGWVFWMLLNHMGRDRALRGLHTFIETYHGNPDHPVLQDFLAVMRRFAGDSAAFDAFARQWFHEVVLPEYRLSDPRKTRTGESWLVTVRLENAGTGTMPVEVATACGERFDKNGMPSSGYRAARAVASLGKGESRDVTIECPFEPQSITVDPDAKVLQLQRKNAEAKF